MTLRTGWGIFLFACGACSAANLLEGAQPAAVTAGAGVLDVFRNGRATDFSLEYRFASVSRWQAQLIGTWSTDGSRFIGAGLLWHFETDADWDVAVGFAPGYYEREHGPPLGSSLEFLSTIEITWPLARGRRFGVGLSHISNGSLGDRNPGAETLRLFWVIPIGR